MKLKADIELKLRRFFRKYGKILMVVFVIIAIIIAVDRIIKNSNRYDEPKTTLTPDEPVLDIGGNVPKKVHSTVEEFVRKYVDYCNAGEFESAYAMISEECKEEYFGSVYNYKEYVKNKFYDKRSYALQSYSTFNKKYIYTVKLFDDILATGLTNSKYKYQEEKIVASYDENKNIVISVGNFIEKNVIQSVQENEYLKVDIKSQIIQYSFEEYKIKLTNRSNYTIIIQNSEAEEDEIVINLGQESRKNEIADEVILEPGETQTISPIFSKFYDDGDVTKELILTSIRVVDENGEEIEKMSMTMRF
ncbi:MAG: hypothetical protein J6J60_04400 [Clostridia bacterium]|nr:hypothetical protein [Clostridia bacterium]